MIPKTTSPGGSDYTYDCVSTWVSVREQRPLAVVGGVFKVFFVCVK